MIDTTIPMLLLQNTRLLEFYWTAYTIMGDLTLCKPSSHTNEAETMSSTIRPLTFNTKESFCPMDVNDKMFGLTLILSPFGAPITVALYVDTGNPTFVTLLLNVREIDSL